MMISCSKGKNFLRVSVRTFACVRLPSCLPMTAYVNNVHIPPTNPIKDLFWGIRARVCLTHSLWNSKSAIASSTDRSLSKLVASKCQSSLGPWSVYFKPIPRPSNGKSKSEKRIARSKSKSCTGPRATSAAISGILHSSIKEYLARRFW
jgi:hypothetical protein